MNNSSSLQFADTEGKEFRRTMERLRLWRYKKLTNENVKDGKVIEKHSDDEDYNSCFKLKRNLKVRVGKNIF